MTPINKSGLWKKRLGDWVINPYVGCQHGCYHCYCPAMPGVKFNNGGRKQAEWGSYLLPKEGIVSALEKQLRSFTPKKAKLTEWGDGWLLMSFLTDCYTPAEARHKLTRQCLIRLLEAGHKVRLQTRSVLARRDFDILAAHKDQVLFGTSLPYFDDKLAKALEPKAAPPSKRFQMMEEVAELGIQTYFAVAPFMPFHGVELLDTILERIKPMRPKEIFCEVLNPKGDNIGMMCNALSRHNLDYANQLSTYGSIEWAQFTYRMLHYGNKQSVNFIPWPDTRRLWKSHLKAKESKFLDAFLPPVAA